jgi:hypothetical protein
MTITEKIEKKLNETTATFDDATVLYIEDGVRNKIFVPLVYLKKALDKNGQIPKETLQKCIKSLEDLDTWVKNVRAKRKFEL